MLKSYHSYHKLSRSIESRDHIAEVVASLIRAENSFVWNEVSNSSEKITAGLNQLNTSGILKCKLQKDCLFRLIDKKEKLKEFNDINKRTCDISELIDINDVLPIATDKSLLRLVSNYLGAPARFQKYTLAWSNRTPTPDPINPQKFHRDRDDFKTLQLFIYLSDVGKCDGPHEYVPGTHNMEKLQEKYEVNNISNGLNHCFLQPDELKQVLGNKNPHILTLQGSAGSAFLEDTGGFHRGTVPKENGSSRLMLGITWSLSKGTGFVNMERIKLILL